MRSQTASNNSEIDVIWEQFQETLEPLRQQLNETLGETWEEWGIPREVGADWSNEAIALHSR